LDSDNNKITNDIPSLWKYIRSGAAAGIISTLIFTIIHHIFIANIWFSFPIMALAGAASGACIAWTYGLLFQRLRLSTWIKFNSFFIGMFVLLGILSVILFEPVTTISALREANERPTELINKSIPLTIVFIFAATIILSLLYGHNLKHYLVILLTNTILILLLGLNVSILGLIFIPTDSLYLLLELFALIVAIFVVYALVFFVLEKKF
jgi:hypothetical protein